MVPAETVIVKGKMQDLQNVVKSYNVLIDYLVKNNMNYPCWKKEVYPNEEIALEAINKQTLFIFKDGEKIAGTIILKNGQIKEYRELEWPSLVEDSKVITIQTLAVHPDYLKKGVAKSMLNFAEEFALDKGCAALRLDVTVQNIPAIRLYEKLGCQLTSYLKR